MIDSYLAYLRDVRRMSENTLESYARDLTHLAAFAEKRGLPVEGMDRRDLEAFVRGLMASGLAPRSVARNVARPTPPTIFDRRGRGPRCRNSSALKRWTGCSSNPILRRRAACVTRR
jgi:hypothetical protein